MDLNISNSGLFYLGSEDQLNWSFRIRLDVEEWCNANLDHPVKLVVTQEVHGLSMLTTVIAQFQTASEAFHFKTRWWGK